MDKRLFSKTRDRNGAAGWQLTENAISLFVTQTGGQMAPVTFAADRNQPIQPYFISPWQKKGKTAKTIPLLQYLRGDFFCLPFGDNGDKLRGKKYPPHGETASEFWRLATAETDQNRTIFEFALQGSVSGADVRKRIALHDGSEALYISHTISNLSGKYPYGHHAILAMPEPGEIAYLCPLSFDLGMTAPGTFANPANLEYQCLASGATFTDLTCIPSRFKDQPTIDLSTMPSPVGYVDLFVMLRKATAKPACTCAVYPQRGYLFFSLKNPNELPGTTIWTSNSGRYGYPWNGNTRCFAIEETCSFFAQGGKPSAEENCLTNQGWKTCATFSKRNPTVIRTIQGVARIPANFGPVANVDFTPGTLTFTDTAGKTTSARTDWEFLS